MTAEQNENYKSVRIKNESYKEFKILAVEEGVPLTKFMDIMLAEYKKTKALSTKNLPIKP